jgi:hypothetical protein
VIKTTQKESDQAANTKYWQKSVKIEQLTKVEFLEGFLLLKSKSVN